MSSIPVYFLSFFKAPICIISSVESIFKKKNLGGGEDFRKIAWVKWDSICLPKEKGGLGVRRIREFNLALLGKWCWRMLVDKDGLWYRGLKARYEEEGGRLKEGRGADLVLSGGGHCVTSVEGVVWESGIGLRIILDGWLVTTEILISRWIIGRAVSL